ncbi:MAG: flagellin [Pseudomonadales bacterium]
MPFSIAGPASPAIPSLDGINRAADRLSSGLRTDYQQQAAEAAISGRLDTLAGESTVNVKNAINQISALQQADQTLQQGKELTQRIQELSVRSANSTLSAADQQAISAERDGLLTDLDDLLENAQFNGQPLFSDAIDGNNDIASIRDQVAQVSSSDEFDQNALSQIQEDLSSLSAELGAEQSGLTQQIEQELDAQLARSFQQSQLADVDYATEVVNLLREQINFEASVKAFDHQRMAESAIINLLN